MHKVHSLHVNNYPKTYLMNKKQTGIFLHFSPRADLRYLNGVRCWFVKLEPHIRLVSENSREHWVRIGEQVNGVRCWFIKLELHIRLVSENSREHWTGIGEQVKCGSVYSHILHIRIYHYVPNTFSVLPNLPTMNIGEYPMWKSVLAIILQFMRERSRMLTKAGFTLISICQE